MALELGQTILNGKYQILKLIGQGAMARVWLAQEPRFGNRCVAIKEPRADLLPELVQEVGLRYQREVQVCAALDQARVPNIMRALTVELHGDSLLLVLDYLPGGDLAGLLKRHQEGLPLEQALSITRELLQALEGLHAHELEIVHRDVKPSNVLFDGAGAAHLGDFGLAQLSGVSGRSRLQGAMHPGTPLYMAPEQGRSGDYLTPAADLYALGCVLFEMLTGQRYKRVRPGTPAGSLRPGLPLWLDEVLAGALTEDPWDRYQQAAEMAAALGEGEQRARKQAATQARAQRLAAAQARAEAALAAGRWPEAKEAAQDWLDLEPESKRAAETLAQAQQMIEGPPLRRTPSGLILAGPDNLAWLLSLPQPPARVWWEKVEMEMCLVPAGEFPMGISDEEARRWHESDWGGLARGTPDMPQHTVYLDPFYLGRCPVTNAQYARFVRATGHRVPYAREKWAAPSNWDRTRQAPPPGKEQHPVVLVSWEDAAAFCRWAGLRLPTEAEWEKAASWDAAAGHKRVYPWGDEWDGQRCNSAERIAGHALLDRWSWQKWAHDWERLDSVQGNQDTTTPVGAYSPAGDSPYGCVDMAGNVCEWCADWYAVGYYKHSPARNPLGPDSGEFRCLRGGSWYADQDGARSADRGSNHPDLRLTIIGFRCGVSPASSP